MYTIRRLGLAVATLLFFSVSASASPITYIDFGTGSGVLNGQSFSSDLITLSFTGDTSNIVNDGGIFKNSVGTLTVTVAGVGSDTITESGSQALANPENIPAAAGLAAGGSVILETLNSLLISYQLGYIGAVTGLPFFNVGTAFTTAGGSFTINNWVGDTTFEAIAPNVVPLPGALPLFATGLGAISLLGWRRKRKAQAA